jgi:hypothetical protein
MNNMVYNYNFPFTDVQNQDRIFQGLSDFILGSQYSLAIERVISTENAFILSQSNNYLIIVVPVPSIVDENPAYPQLDAEYHVAIVTITRKNSAREDESIMLETRIIKTDKNEYQALVAQGNPSGLLSLSIPVSMSEAPPSYSTALYPHKNKQHVQQHFSAATRIEIHRAEVMSAIGRQIGEWVWKHYANTLTKQLNLRTNDEVLFYIAQSNNSDTNYPSTQYVGIYKQHCLIVCEELQYPTDQEAVPRYAVIPGSTFDHSLAKGITAAKQLGFAFLSSPGVSSYMRMRPSLAGRLGLAASAAIDEAIANANSIYGKE